MADIYDQVLDLFDGVLNVREREREGDEYPTKFKCTSTSA